MLKGLPKLVIGYFKENWLTILLVVIMVLIVNSLFIYSCFTGNKDPSMVPTFRHPKEGGDQMVYFSLIRQAAEGKNLLLNLYTNESQIGLISPLWWLIGKIVAITKGSIEIIYYLITIVSSIGLLLFINHLIKPLFASGFFRQLTLYVIAFGGGLGWLYFPKIVLINISKLDLLATPLPVDLWYSEGFGFHTLQHSPLFVITQALIIYLLWVVAEKYESLIWTKRILIGLLAGLLTLIHPYDAIILVAFIFVFGFFEKKQNLFNWWLKLWPIIIACVLALSYFYFLRYFDPSFLGWSKQNITQSPHPFSYILGYGFLLVPAFFGGRLLYKENNLRGRWLLIWVFLVIFLIVFPFVTNVQRRFGSGIYIPLSILAVYGLSKWIKDMSKVWALLTICFYVTLISITAVVSIILNIKIIDLKTALTFISSSENEAMSYYKNHSNVNDVLLTTKDVGNIVPAKIAKKVYIGHGHQTVKWIEKGIFTEWFYKNIGLEESKHNELVRRGINYVWIGPSEEKFPLQGLNDGQFFSLIYSNDKVRIYRVK